MTNVHHDKRSPAPPRTGGLALLKFTFWVGGTNLSTFERKAAWSRQLFPTQSTETEPGNAPKSDQS